MVQRNKDKTGVEGKKIVCVRRRMATSFHWKELAGEFRESRRRFILWSIAAQVENANKLRTD